MFRPKRPAADLAQREAGRERLVGDDAVHPERGAAVAEDAAGGSAARSSDQRRVARRPGRRSRAGARRARAARRPRRACRRSSRAARAASSTARRRRRRRLPGAPAAAREPACGEEQRDPGEHRGRARERADRIGRERAEQPLVVAGRTACRSSARRRPRRATRRPGRRGRRGCRGSVDQRAAEPGERRREVDGVERPARSSASRAGICRTTAIESAVGEVDPQPDAERRAGAPPSAARRAPSAARRRAASPAAAQTSR